MCVHLIFPKGWEAIKCGFISGLSLLFHWSMCLLCVFQCHTWRRQWHPTPVLLPGRSHGQRSLVGCSPWGREESDTTEWLPFHFSLPCIGEGSGNSLECSCLENPRGGGAWWAAVSGVTQSRTRLKRLSSSSLQHHPPCNPRHLLLSVYTHDCIWVLASPSSIRAHEECQPSHSSMDPITGQVAPLTFNFSRDQSREGVNRTVGGACGLSSRLVSPNSPPSAGLHASTAFPPWRGSK